MDGNGCSIGTHILSYKPHFTCNPVGLMGNELLFKDNKSNHKGNCYDHNDQKQELDSMLLTSFT